MGKMPDSGRSRDGDLTAGFDPSAVVPLCSQNDGGALTLSACAGAKAKGPILTFASDIRKTDWDEQTAIASAAS